MTTKISYFNSLRAEWTKSMSKSVKGLIIFCVALVIGIGFLANYMDVYNRVAFNVNPWERFFSGGMAIYVLFVLPSFLIFLIGAVTYIEERANGWKFMYTLNVSRLQTYLAKVSVVIFLILMASLLLSGLLVLAGLGLDLVLPEYEFAYYTPNYGYLIEVTLRATVSCLGAIGLQFMISMITNNVILSMGIGVVGYIVGFILSFSDTSAVLYNPYALVMIDQDFGAIDSDYKKELIEGILTNVEAYSLFYFILFTTIGILYESRKSIK